MEVMLIGDRGGGDGEGDDGDHSDGVLEVMMTWLMQKRGVEVLMLVSALLEYFCAEYFHVLLSHLVLIPTLSE